MKKGTNLRAHTSLRSWPPLACNKMLSYRRETALQAALVLVTSGRIRLGDDILRTL